MPVMTVSTDRVSRVDDNSNHVELGITFYPHDENQAPKVVKVVMPKTWPPNHILSLELMSLQRQTYTTINELQWLLSSTEEATHSQLACLGSYIRVSGSILKKV
jgi:hypothetical protein